MFTLIRGAGDIATGIALRLYRSGFKVAMLETGHPTCIRRTVAFSDAVFRGAHRVENVESRLVQSVDEGMDCIAHSCIPVLIDPELSSLSQWQPQILVDAILAKKNLGTRIDMAGVVIGVGPGFTAGVDCHAVVETMRGHNLGRVILNGSAQPNTNIPGLIGGYTGERVLRAPADGIFHQFLEIGAHVQEGDAVGEVQGQPVKCTISGVLRGILPDGTPVTKGLKSGDVDPRGDASFCQLVSDKALAVGGGVLEAALMLSGALRGV